MSTVPISIQGYGVAGHLPNRFDPISIGPDPDFIDHHPAAPKTVFLNGTTRQILCRNDRPDVWSEWSINLYRGCEHACPNC
jgi:hypothetical protein